MSIKKNVPGVGLFSCVSTCILPGSATSETCMRLGTKCTSYPETGALNVDNSCLMIEIFSKWKYFLCLRRCHQYEFPKQIGRSLRHRTGVYFCINTDQLPAVLQNFVRYSNKVLFVTRIVLRQSNVTELCERFIFENRRAVVQTRFGWCVS